MEKSLFYLNETYSYLNSMVDISLADSFFEEADEVTNAIKQNEKAQTGAIASLKKLFASLIETVKKYIQKFTDWIKTKFMQKEERERYAQFKEYIKQHPEIAQEKISIPSFKEYEKVYGDAIKGLEKENAKSNPSEEAMKKVAEKLSKTLDTMGKTGKKAAMYVTLDTAIKIADKNVISARAINSAMQAELIDLQNIEKELGSAQAIRFQNKIQRYAKNGVFHRLKVGILGRKNRTLEACLSKQINKLLSFTNYKSNDPYTPIVTRRSIARGTIRNTGLVKAIRGTDDSNAKIAANAALDSVASANDRLKMRRRVRRASRDVKNFKSFIGLDN